MSPLSHKRAWTADEIEPFGRTLVRRDTLLSSWQFSSRTNGCERLAGLLERKDEAASTWPFRPNRFSNWFGLHESRDC